MHNLIRERRHMKLDNEGQTVVEYVLVLVLIVLAIIAAFQTADIQSAISTQAENIQDHLTSP